jgi:intracellular multiplication protein IcmK
MPAAYLIPSQQQPAGASAPAGQPAGQLVFVPAGTPLPPGAQALAPPSHEAPATAAAQPPSPEDLAFQQALQSLLPLSAPQVTKYKQSLDETQRAVAAPVGAAPRPVTSSIPLSLKPGEKQPRLRLYPGNATTLTFSDVTGAPWPVMSVTTGNPNAYVAQEAGERGKTNMVVISPLTTHAVANNLVVTLVNHPVPVIFTLETGVAEVDYRLDVSIQARGPNAAYDIVGSSTLAPTSDRTVQALLDGVPPKGARKVSTSNGDVEAWKLNDLVYVRTPLELMSPAHVGRARNVSGTNVFTLIDAPVLVFSQDGRLASVTIGR